MVYRRGRWGELMVVATLGLGLSAVAQAGPPGGDPAPYCIDLARIDLDGVDPPMDARGGGLWFPLDMPVEFEVLLCSAARGDICAIDPTVYQGRRVYVHPRGAVAIDMIDPRANGWAEPAWAMLQDRGRAPVPPLVMPQLLSSPVLVRSARLGLPGEALDALFIVWGAEGDELFSVLLRVLPPPDGRRPLPPGEEPPSHQLVADIVYYRCALDECDAGVDICAGYHDGITGHPFDWDGAREVLCEPHERFERPDAPQFEQAAASGALGRPDPICGGEPTFSMRRPFPSRLAREYTVEDDLDGVLDCVGGAGVGCDNCPGEFNPDQLDSDGDGVGDLCSDCDHDGDGLYDDPSHADMPRCRGLSPKPFDNCPFVPNPVEGFLEIQADTDGDGVGDACDNCVEVPNYADPFAGPQADLDRDGQGDACDTDADGDFVIDVGDNCPRVVNPAQTDGDGDGVGDACDPDIDGDGQPNDADLCPFLPSRWHPWPWCDPFSDGQMPDADGDGVIDKWDLCPLVPAAADNDEDGDGRGAMCDADDDGDLLLDACDEDCWVGLDDPCRLGPLMMRLRRDDRWDDPVICGAARAWRDVAAGLAEGTREPEPLPMPPLPDDANGANGAGGFSFGFWGQ